VLFHRRLTMAADSTCQGMTYDANKFEASLLIRSNDESFKVVNKGYTTTKPNDAFIFVISDAGSVSRGIQVSFSAPYSGASASNQVFMKFGLNGLRRIGQYYIFAGNCAGFVTSQQNEVFAQSKDNSFVMKYLMDKNNNHNCLFEGPTQKLPPITSVTTSVAADASSVTQTSQIIRYSNFFKAYSSPYSGAFDLLDT
jgi:hypothetical protein